MMESSHTIDNAVIFSNRQDLRIEARDDILRLGLSRSIQVAERPLSLDEGSMNPKPEHVVSIGGPKAAYLEYMIAPEMGFAVYLMNGANNRFSRIEVFQYNE